MYIHIRSRGLSSGALLQDAKNIAAAMQNGNDLKRDHLWPVNNCMVGIPD